MGVQWKFTQCYGMVGPRLYRKDNALQMLVSEDFRSGQHIFINKAV